MSSQQEVLDLGSLERMSIPVRMGDKEYTLYEADGNAANAYRNAVLSGAQLNDGGKVASIGNIADAEPLLLSRCLFLKEGENLSPVSIETILSFPNRVVEPLIKKLKEISELTSEEELEKDPLPKKEPESTTTGSK